jgi:hypothetical protein
MFNLRAFTVLLSLLAGLWLLSAHPLRAEEPQSLPQLQVAAPDLVSIEDEVERSALDTAEASAPVSSGPDELEYPDRCDRLVLRDTPSGEQLSKERPKWLRKAKTRWPHQQKLRRQIHVIADELGADETAAEMIWRKAIYESSGNAGNVHIRTKDVEANRTAAGKGRKRSAKRWRRVRVPVYKKLGGRWRHVDSHDAWALGRGLYGMVTGLYAHWWGDDAPPWALCDPIVSTVTIIWAMRAGLDQCHGTTLRDAYRRYSSGKCALRTESLERRFDRLARGRVRGLELGAFDPDALAQLGAHWPEESTNRAELYRVIQARLAQEV